MSEHASAASAWVGRWAHLIAPAGAVLDVAAGSGRHARLLAARGHAVTAIDRDERALAELAAHVPNAELVVADVEGRPWPLVPRTFAAVIVTNYLWRPLFPALRAALEPGGALLCETIAAGNETVGRPRNPQFLLQPGELLRLAEGLHVVAYEDGFLSAPDRFVQRIAAVAPPLGMTPRFALEPAAGR